MARSELQTSSRSRLRRKTERGSHDRALVDAILDEGLLCHVGFADGESTFVLPTGYARVGDRLFLHGAAANHMLRTLGSGVQACVAVTLLDGLVLARSTRDRRRFGPVVPSKNRRTSSFRSGPASCPSPS